MPEKIVVNTNYKKVIFVISLRDSYAVFGKCYPEMTHERETGMYVKRTESYYECSPYRQQQG